jgi:hypothetical protein
MFKSMATPLLAPSARQSTKLLDLKPRQGRPDELRAKWRAFAAAVHSTAARANSFSNTFLLERPKRLA